MDDYLVLQLGIFDRLIKPKFVCYKPTCKTILNCEPYQPIQAQTIQDFGQKVYCTECQEHFCSRCWTNHKNDCNFEVLFKKYCKQKKMINCPNCHVVCELHNCPPSYGIINGHFRVQNQQCPLCNHNFCGQCYGNLQCFGNFEYAQAGILVMCEPCKTKYESFVGLLRRLIPEIGIYALVALILIIVFIVMVIYKIMVTFKDTNILVFQQMKSFFETRTIIVRIIIFPLSLVMFVPSVAVLFVFQCIKKAIGWVKQAIPQTWF